MASTLDVASTRRAAHGGSTVRIEHVSVSYDGRHDAVTDVDLVVQAGSITALLGPSGCGKTSLLRAIAGLERPTTGTITIGDTMVSSARVSSARVSSARVSSARVSSARVSSARSSDGERSTWVRPERRNVGMVFQDGALFPHLTVAENIAFGLRSAGVRLARTGRARRVEEMLHLVDLDGLGDRLPDTLSGGQQQRVALARSLAPHPAVLLLDEPFSALDASLRVQVRAEVARILREVGVTAVFVTHDQDEAFVLGDTVAVMRDGHVEQVGTPDELYRSPVSPWIAGFVGEANLLTGRVADGRAVSALGSLPLAAAVEVAPDDTVTVLVRPEHVTMEAGGDAVVTAVEYYGHDVRYELQLPDGSQLAARSNRTSRLFERGDQVRIGYDGEPTRAWRSR